MRFKNAWVLSLILSACLLVTNVAQAGVIIGGGTTSSVQITQGETLVFQTDVHTATNN